MPKFGRIRQGAELLGTMLGRKVAPAALRRERSINPRTVTQGAKTGRTLTEAEVTAEAEAQGEQLLRTQDSPARWSHYGRGGEEIRTDIESVRAAQESIKRKVGLPDMLSPSGNLATSAAAAGIMTGAPISLFAGLAFPFLHRALDEDVDNTTLAASGGALLGVLVGLTRYKSIFSAFTREAVRRGEMPLLKLFEPLIADAKATAPFTDTEAKALVGKSGVKNTEWLRFKQADRVEHTVQRVAAAVNRKRKGDSADHKWNAVQAILRKFTLNSGTLEEFNAVKESVYQAGKDLGQKPEELERLWLGYLAQVTVPQNYRRFRISANLPTKGQQGKRALAPAKEIGPNTDIETLTEAIISAKIESGTGGMAITHENAATFGRIAMIPSPEAIGMNELIAASAIAQQRSSGLGLVTRTLDMWHGSVLGYMRPSEQFRTTARAFKEKGIPEADVMLKFADGVEQHLTQKQINIETWSGRKNRMLRGVRPDQHSTLMKMLEGDAATGATAADIQALHVGKNDLVQVAKEARRLVDDIAGAVGMPPEAQLSDYLSWVYTQRASWEIKATLGGFPLAGPGYLSAPPFINATKHWNHAMRRTSDIPLGERMTFLETLDSYIWGAARKKAIDDITTTVIGTKGNAAELRMLAEKHPLWTKGFTEWLKSIHGIPQDLELTTRGVFQGIGVDFDRWAELSGIPADWWIRDFSKSIATNGVFKVANAIKSAELYMKMGGSMMSAIVNMTQTWINTGADAGLLNIFIGGAQAVRDEVVGAGERLAARSAKGSVGDTIGNYIGMIRFNAQGPRLDHIRRQGGIMSSNVKLMLDDMSFTTGKTPESFFGKGLKHVLNASLWMFQTAEVTNRVLTTGAFGRLSHQASALETGIQQGGAAAAAALRRARRQEVGELAAEGGAIGGLLGGVTGDEDGFDFEGALVGAGAGAALGGLGGSIGRPRAVQAAMDKRIISGIHTPTGDKGLWTDAARDLANKWRPTSAEVEAAYVNQATMMTQFSLGKEFRPAMMRNPAGDVLMTLQQFMFKQMEFVGARFGSFGRSLGLQATGQGTPAMRAGLAAPGADIDMRVWKHLAMLGGTSAALTAAGGFLNPGENADVRYWVSRIGFGLLPFVRWNDSAQGWQVENPVVTVGGGGPFGSDVMNATQTIFRLMTDPAAQEQWDVQGDQLGRELFVFLRQADNLDKDYGAGVGTLLGDGMRDAFEAARTTDIIGSPAGALRGLAGGTASESPGQRTKRQTR